MHNPTKQQVQVVIDTLNKAAAMADGNCPVDMAWGETELEHPCGSPMCHGGWYGLVHGFWYYAKGANRMAFDLGFESKRNLQEWADNNPLLWGNNEGYEMFHEDKAFGVSKLTSLQQIINHWQQVQSRLPE